MPFWRLPPARSQDALVHTAQFDTLASDDLLMTDSDA